MSSPAPTTRSVKRAFRHSSRLGTGRAYLLARAYPDVDFSDYIIEAAIRNFAYDGQAESDRSVYVYGLHCLSGQQARIRRAILHALATEQADTWTLTQLVALALKFAQAGDAQARQAIYRRFLVRPIDGSDWVGADAIMTLDGLDGLKYIARKVGRRLGHNPNGWEDEMHLKSFQHEYPAVDAWAELRQLATADEDVRRYLAYVEAAMASRNEHRTPAKSPDSDLAGMLRTRSRYTFRQWLRRRGLKPHEVGQLAEQLLTEQDPLVRENLYAVFTLFPFPLPFAPILAQARQKPRRQNQQLIRYALDALSLLQAPEIRAFALEQLRRSSQPGRYAEILRSNYQEGDGALLTALVERTHHDHGIESLAISYTSIYEANNTPECAAPLLALYAKMTCAIHRSAVVEILLKNDVLPAWLNDELLFDSYAETRALHRSRQ